MAHTFKDPKLEAIVLRKQARQVGAPIEDAWERTSWRRIVSHHNVDLAFVAAVYFFAIFVAIGAVVASGMLQKEGSVGPGLQILFGTAVFGTFIELLRRTYDTAIKRLSTADLFTSEMLSIMRVFVSGNIIGDFVRLYDVLDTIEAKAAAPEPSSSSPDRSWASGFADTARKENYFSIFEKNSSDLGSLDPAVVNDITAFYTFLKAARDATGSIQLWKDPNYDIAAMKDDVVTIVYHCFLMTVHAKIALERLIASTVNRAIVEDIIAGVLLQCFCFLDHVLPKDDFRWPRIEQRRGACVELARQHHYAFALAAA